ncbi:transketolase [Sulfoacidibacillus thermotolerans]|uniref:Transketolase n=1 Tax=Sulfoacidibacillus thermotolerans TaxID=1765684 RepID=A0A2U3DA23_SULT2|nr:transketolase [Sulfoacidibacillus thermotolerans]PWI58137.1 transketolase [Sulfoacidibacillus thermotolerans]
MTSIDELTVSTLRTLCIDSVEQANSGHPGLPMGAAPMAYTLWSRFLRHNPKNPSFANRDRFILSAGHGSTLLYSLLHLFGYDLTLDDLKQFRQWGSKTPGHPERGHTPGVETTTGPLGQGIANAVGMAMVERFLATKYNRPEFPLFDHRTYALVGDGDLMEGISYEAASLAGHLALDKLIVLYDSNDISLDGPTENAFTEDIVQRFTAANWNVLRVEDGNDLNAIAQALQTAQEQTGRPTLIEVRTTIGYGSPGRQGTAKAHGMPLGSEEARLAKAAYGWHYEEAYTVPKEVRQHLAPWIEQGERIERAWNEQFNRYKATYPELGEEVEKVLYGQLTDNWDAELPTFTPQSGEFATRQASGQTINALAKQIPNLLGGSADLASSNETTIKTEATFSRHNYAGRNLWFGVREHAMGAILNGMAAHGGVRVYGATFLVFSDYLRPAIRLAGLMKLPVTYVFTHDSIGVGEDGPTHQPIEHLASLRIIPNVVLIRPADANETVAAWRYSIGQNEHPVALALTRQKLPVLPGTDQLAQTGVARGAYILSKEATERIDAILLASGSEVSLAYRAKQRLEAQGLSIRLVSIPSFALFDMQDQAYRDEILPPHITARVGVEMAHPFGWDRYLGNAGEMVGIDHFGASAPAPELMKHFGFTEDAVISATLRSIERSHQA